MTCAHLPFGKLPTPDWSLWPSSLTLCRRPDQQFSLPLFDSAAGERRPTFYFGITDGGFLSDLLVFDTARAGFPPRQLFSEFRRAKLDGGLPGAGPGDRLYGYGFPGLSAEGKWPYMPADETSGVLLGERGIGFESDMPSHPGHSGGPAFLADGRFVGMILGSTKGRTQLMSRGAISGLIEAFENLERTKL